MIKELKYLLILVLVFACNTNSIEKPKKPNNLIGKAKMVDIIYDMSLFTAAKGVGKWNLENEGISPETFIYEKYAIDSLQFVLSNAYYSYDTENLKGIYNKVNERLQNQKVYFDSIIENEDIERGKSNLKQREMRGESLEESLDELKGRDFKKEKTKGRDKRPNRDLLKKTDSSRQLIRQ